MITEYRKQIKDLESKIHEIQEQCSHPDACVNVTPKSDTGNYDPSEDSYWVEYHCKLCDKKWTIPYDS